MVRIELGSADDWELQARLLAALRESGFVSEGESDWDDGSLPRGQTPFRRGSVTLSIYCDAWRFDLVGADEVVQQVVAALQLS